MKARITAALLLLTITSGCGTDRMFFPQISEISKIEIIQVMGIDVSDDDENGMEVTLLANRSAAYGESGSSDKTTEIMTFTGPTILEAVSKINLYSDRKYHLGYIDFLLIGEKAAQEDVTKYLDYLMRDYESRYTMEVFVIRDSTAKDFLKETATESRNTADALANLKETANTMSNTRLVSMIDIISQLGRDNTAAVIPALRSVKADFGEMIGSEMPDKMFMPAGFAVLKDFKLAGYFDGNLARAYNYLTGSVHELPFSVEGPGGDTVALLALSEKMEVTSQWDGDTLLGVTYKILIGANLAEQSGHVNIFTEEAFRELEKKCAALAKSEFEQVIEKAQKIGQDSLRINDRIRMTHPIKWEKMADNWDKIFSEIEIKIETDCQIYRSFDMCESMESSGEQVKQED